MIYLVLCTFLRCNIWSISQNTVNLRFVFWWKTHTLLCSSFSMVYKTLLMNYCQIIFCKKRSKSWSCQPHTYYQQGGQGGPASPGSQWLPPGVFNSHQQKQDWHHLCKYWLQYLDFLFHRRLHLISLEILSRPLHDNHLFSTVFLIPMKSCAPIIS